MKVELRDAKVELEVGEGKHFLHINGQNVPIPRDVGVALIFGEEKPRPAPTAPTKPCPPSKAERKYGCQTPSARKKLSASLLKFHAKRRRKEAAELKKGTPTKKHLNGKSHLNGAGLHIN